MNYVSTQSRCTSPLVVPFHLHSPGVSRHWTRHLWGYSSLLGPCLGEWALAQLQGWRFYSLSGTSAPVLGWPHSEEYFFLASHQNVHVAAASIASRRVPVSSSLRAPRKRKQLNPLVAFELSKPTSLSLFAHHPLTVTPWLSPWLSAKLSPVQHCLSGTPERH